MKKSGNGLIRKGTYLKSKCIYCGQELDGNATKDHVPPRFIFKNYSSEIKAQRITAPCCSNCNQEYSVLEQRLVLFFELLSENKVNADIIRSNIFDFNALMRKIALGYIFHESSNYYFRAPEPIITYFLGKDVDKKRVLEFKGISTNDVIEDISSNPQFSGLLIFEDDILIASTPTDMTSEFWHSYNVNQNYVRMSFYNNLFVHVQF